MHVLDGRIAYVVIDGYLHFLPPGVACTTCLSHNRFTWLSIRDGKNAYAKK